MQNDPFLQLLDKLAAIETLGQHMLPIASAELVDLQQQAAAAGKRRSRDERRYALGGLMLALDLDCVDYHELYGLLAHLDHFLGWAIEARASAGAWTLGAIIRQILDDKKRAARCSEWGRHLAWTQMRELYQAEVEGFLRSEKAGQKSGWRRDAITAAQQYLINEICKIENIENPKILKKGQAFEWLRERGGNPRYQARPSPIPLDRL